MTPDLCAIARDHKRHGRQWYSYDGWSKSFRGGCVWLSTADAERVAAEVYMGSAYVVRFAEVPNGCHGVAGQEHEWHDSFSSPEKSVQRCRRPGCRAQRTTHKRKATRER